MIEKKENEVCECEKCITEQKRTASATWWVGMALCVAQGVCGVLVASDAITDIIAGAITGGFAIVFTYFNGNNPSIKGQY